MWARTYQWTDNGEAHHHAIWIYKRSSRGSAGRVRAGFRSRTRLRWIDVTQDPDRPMIHECLSGLDGQYVCLAGDIGFNASPTCKGFLAAHHRRFGQGAIYALVAVGYTLVFGVLRLINFAHSEIFMLGMFGAYFCLNMILGSAERQTPTTRASG